MNAASTILFNDHASDKGVASPDAVLAGALQRMPELAASAAALFAAEPRAKAVALRLAEYLMHAVPAAPGEPVSLLERCLERGLQSVAIDRPALSRFLQGALHHIHQVAGWHVFARRRNHTVSWDCCSGTLHAWLVGQGSPRLRVAPRPAMIGDSTSPKLVRAIVACRVLSSPDLLGLGRELDNVLFGDA